MNPHRRLALRWLLILGFTYGTVAVTNRAQSQGSTSLAPEIVGQLGGATKAIAADAAEPARAYLGQGPRVIVLDVSNPDSPAPIGQSPILPAVVADLEVEGGIAYAATQAGLSVIDLSDPLSSRVSQERTLWPWTADAAWGSHQPRLDLDGDRLYLVSGREEDLEPIHVFDLSDPLQPREVTRLRVGEPPGNHAIDIAVGGGLALVQLAGDAPNESSLAIFDTSREGEPRDLGVHRNPEPIDAFAFSAPWLLISDDACSLRLSHMGPDGEIEERACLNLDMISVTGIEVIDGLAALSEGSSAVWIVDWTRLEWPKIVTRAAVAHLDLATRPDGRGWLAALQDGGMQVLEIDPGTEGEILSRHTLIDPGQPNRPRKMVLQGSQLWISLLDGLAGFDLSADGSHTMVHSERELAGNAELAAGLGWLAVTDERSLGGIDILAPGPENPGRRLARIEVEGRPIDLAASGDRLIVLGDHQAFGSDGRGRYIEVYDLSRPSAARAVGKREVRPARQLVAAQGLAYSSGAGYMEVFDVAGTGQPTYRGHVDGVGEGCVGPEGGHQYCGGRRLQVIDVRDPDAPRLIDRGWEESGSDPACWRPLLSGSLLYCGYHEHGLGGWRFDLSNPAAPRLTGHGGLAGRLHAVARHDGNTVFLSVAPDAAPGELDLLVVSEHRPASIEEYPAWWSLARTGSLAVEGALAILTTEREGAEHEGSPTPMLVVIDISEPDRPVMLSQTLLDFDPWRTAADGWLVYIANHGRNRIRIFDLRDPANPREVNTIERESGTRIIDLAAGGGHLWIADADGLSGYTIDPTSGAASKRGSLPSRRNRLELDMGTMHDLWLDGEDLLVIDTLGYHPSQPPPDSDMILAIDIRQPERLEVVSRYQLPDTRVQAASLAVDGDRVLVGTLNRSNRLSELWILDRGDSGDMRLDSVLRWEEPSLDYRIDALRDGLAFASSYEGLLAILDLRLEPEPRVVRKILLPGQFNEELALAEDGTLWATDWRAGLLALRVDPGTWPTATAGPSPTRRPSPTVVPTVTAAPSATPSPLGEGPLYLPRTVR